MDVEYLAQKILSEIFTPENIHDSDVAKVFKHVEPIVSTAMNMADALQVYFNKRGAAHALRAGDEDIAALADVLAEWGALEQRCNNL